MRLQMVSTKDLESPRLFRKEAFELDPRQGGRCLVWTLVLVPTKADSVTKERSCKRGDGIVNSLTLPREKEVDHEARIVKLHLELANLKEGETENIADFIARADILAKKLPGFQVEVGLIQNTRRGCYFSVQDRRVLHLATSRPWSKHYTFLVVKTVHLIQPIRS